MENSLTTGEQKPYTQEQLELIKNTVAKNATNDELKLFMVVANKAGLDPFTKQIHFVKRKVKNKDGSWGEVGSHQVSIDGLRAVAERTGNYAGNDDPVFDNETNPQSASVTVYKIVQGVRCPFTATARWSQYYPGDAQGFMWKKMPHLMLGKCAEALALRKAFPNNLSGLYTHDEMQQANSTVVEAKEVTLERPAQIQPPITQPVTQATPTPSSQPPANPTTQTPQPETPANQHICPDHKKVMRPGKNGSYYCPTKVLDGWCTYKIEGEGNAT